MSRFRKVAIYTGCGLAGFAGISSYFRSPRIKVTAAEAVQQIKPSRTVHTGADRTGLKLTLFQYQTCPFCCKVRAYLNYYGFNYNVVEVNPVMRKQIQFSEWKKVPIVLVDAGNGKGLQELNDSSMIISSLHSFVLDKSQDLEEVTNCYPSLTHENEDGKKVTTIHNRYNIMYKENRPASLPKETIANIMYWRRWADEVLVHTLSPNVYRTPKEALQAFGWFSQVGGWEQHFPTWERWMVIYVGSAAMYLVGKRLKKRHALKEDVRESLYDACREWTREIKGQEYHGGVVPDLADLSVYGVLSAIEGCEAFGDLVHNTKVGPWYDRMKTSVESRAGANQLA